MGSHVTDIMTSGGPEVGIRDVVVSGLAHGATPPVYKVLVTWVSRPHH
jgi:hypothetical protein